MNIKFAYSIILAITSAIFALPAFADYVRGFGSSSNYFSSSDMTLVEVTFTAFDKSGRQPLAPVNNENSVSVKLPRAYIHWPAGVYRSTKNRPLPDRITIPWLIMLFAHPNGEAYKIFAKDSRNKSVEVKGKKISLLRYNTMKTLIRFDNRGHDRLVRSIIIPEKRPSNLFRNFAGIDEGFRVYTYFDSFVSFYGSITDPFQVAECSKPRELSHIGWWCKYTIILNEYFVAELSFVDFRLHGGRKFATERISAWRNIVCKYIRCKILPVLENRVPQVQ